MCGRLINSGPPHFRMMMAEEVCVKAPKKRMLQAYQYVWGILRCV